MRACERVLPSLARSPEETAWEDGTFKLSVDFTEDYPNKAPTVKFMTKMFHPNSAHAPRGPCASCAPAAAARPRRRRARSRAVYADGSICLDILQNQWSPIYDISAILTSIQSLLCDPNPNSPANSEAARLYQVATHTATARRARAWTRPGQCAPAALEPTPRRDSARRRTAENTSARSKRLSSSHGPTAATRRRRCNLSPRDDNLAAGGCSATWQDTSEIGSYLPPTRRGCLAAPRGVSCGEV